MSQVWAWPSLVSGRDQFCMCQMVVRGRRGICQNRWKRDMWGTGGIYSSEPRDTRGGPQEVNGIIPLEMKPQ
jgi:hypothetical protein